MPNPPTSQPVPGYNEPISRGSIPPIINPDSQPSHIGYLRSSQVQRDLLSQRLSIIETTKVRSLWLVTVNQNPVLTTQVEVSPRPYIQRVGTESRPVRLLSGNEVILSEDDLRVTGISKRYSINDIWHWGLVYVIDPVFLPNTQTVDLDQSTCCELVFLDDSHPLHWQLNLRRKQDHRLSSHEYDLPEL
jgi:hypothetical protein